MAVLPANWPTTGGSYNGTNANNTENAVNANPAKGVAAVVATTPLPAGVYNNAAAGVGATFTVTANGTTTIDSHVLAANEKVLVVGQASPVQNGLYDVTVAGTGGISTVLTRSAVMNSAADFPGAMVIVGGAGATYINTVWVCTATGSPVIGSTNLPFVQPRTKKPIGTTTSTATPTFSTDTYHVYKITAQAAAITGWTITGNPADRDELTITVKDAGTSQAISWAGSPFLSSGVASLPNATPAGKKMTLKFVYDADVAAWVLFASDLTGY